MKKSIIAGASVLAMAGALMPMAGVFAASTDVTTAADTLQIVVEPTCSFTTDNGGEIATRQTFTDTVLNGKKAAFKVGGSAKTIHTFNVVCNDKDGWQVTAGGGNMTGTDAQNAHVIEMVAAAVPAADSGVTEGQWSGALSGDGVIAGGYIPVATTQAPTPVIATESASTDSSTFVVTYDAYVGTETAADTYTRIVNYTLTNL